LPKDTWLHKQNFGSLGSIGMSASVECTTPMSTNLQVRELVFTTSVTLLIGFGRAANALSENGALVNFVPPKK